MQMWYHSQKKHGILVGLGLEVPPDSHKYCWCDTACSFSPYRMRSRNHTIVGWWQDQRTSLQGWRQHQCQQFEQIKSAPCSKACRMWTMILVSASLLQSSIGTDSPHADTACPDVTQTDFVGGLLNDSILDIKKANSFFLFIWSPTKFFHCLVSWLSQTLSSVHPFLSFHE